VGNPEGSKCGCGCGKRFLSEKKRTQLRPKNSRKRGRREKSVAGRQLKKGVDDVGDLRKNRGKGTLFRKDDDGREWGPLKRRGVYQKD